VSRGTNVRPHRCPVAYNNPSSPRETLINQEESQSELILVFNRTMPIASASLTLSVNSVKSTGRQLLHQTTHAPTINPIVFGYQER